MHSYANARGRRLFIEMGYMKKPINRTRWCIVYRSLTLVLLVFSALAVFILVGGPSSTCYHTHLIIELFQCELNHLLKWFGIVVDWCVLAEVDLHVDVHVHVEEANSPLHLVGPSQCTSMCITLLV